MKKKKYTELECTVIDFENEDIVTTSGLSGLTVTHEDNIINFTDDFGTP